VSIGARGYGVLSRRELGGSGAGAFSRRESSGAGARYFYQYLENDKCSSEPARISRRSPRASG